MRKPRLTSLRQSRKTSTLTEPIETSASTINRTNGNVASMVLCYPLIALIMRNDILVRVYRESGYPFHYLKDYTTVRQPGQLMSYAWFPAKKPVRLRILVDRFLAVSYTRINDVANAEIT